MSKQKSWGLKKVAVPEFGKIFGVTAVSAILLGNTSYIEKSYASEDEVPLMDTVVVTATRQEEKISKIPANVTVISEQDIAESPAATVPELLRTTPGVFVNDITGNGRGITVDLRGIGEAAGANTLVLIDGRRVNQTDLSNTDWTLIPKNQVKRIEIVRGSRGSVFYGDNAAGGVVNIITKKGSETKVTSNIAVGSYNSLIGSAGISGENEKISYGLYANYNTSDGYRDNSESMAKDIGASFDLFPSDRFKVKMSAGYHEDDLRMPGGLTLTEFATGLPRTATTHPDDYGKIKDYYFHIVPEFFIADNSFFKVETSTRTRQNSSFISYGSGTSLYETEIDTVIISPQLVYNEKIWGYNSKFTIGLDYTDSKLKIYNISTGWGASTKNAQESKDNIGYYLHEDLTITDKLTVSGGFRHDRVKLKFPSDSTPEQVIIDEESFTLGLTYLINHNLSSFASYSTSFRYPLLDEIFSYYDSTFNTIISSQAGDNVEAGILFQMTPKTKIGLNIFRIETEDEIYQNITAWSNSNRNLDGKTIRQGVEAIVSKKMSNLLLTGSYSYKDSEIEGGTYDGSEIPNVPTHQFSLGAEIKPCNNIIINLDGSYVGERVFISDYANTHNDQNDYFYMTGKISYLLKKGSLHLTVNNILNQEYAEYGVLKYNGDEGTYPSPKINIMAGLNLEF